MFFIKTGRLIAHLVFWLSLFQVVTGLGFVYGGNSAEQLEAISRRYYGGPNIGVEIDEAFIRILYAVGAGMLAEIATAIHEMARKHHPPEAEEE